METRNARPNGTVPPPEEACVRDIVVAFIVCGIIALIALSPLLFGIYAALNSPDPAGFGMPWSVRW